MKQAIKTLNKFKFLSLIAVLILVEREDIPSFREGAPGIKFDWMDKFAPRLGFAVDVLGNAKSTGRSLTVRSRRPRFWHMPRRPARKIRGSICRRSSRGRGRFASALDSCSELYAARTEKEKGLSLSRAVPFPFGRRRGVNRF